MAVNSGWWNTVHPDGKILLFPFGGLLLVSEQIAKPPKWSKWWFLIGIKMFSESFSSLKIIRYLVKEPCSYWRHAIFNWTEPDCWRTSSLMEHPSGCFGSLMFAGRPWWFWNQTDQIWIRTLRKNVSIRFCPVRVCPGVIIIIYLLKKNSGYPSPMMPVQLFVFLFCWTIEQWLIFRLVVYSPAEPSARVTEI